MPTLGGAFLPDLPLPVVGVAMVAVLLLARELGAWLYRRFVPGDAVGSTTAEGYILSAVLGLLALLVAFTFSLSLSRHEMRRSLVVAEANAIGTATLRLDLLEPAARTELRGLWRDYVGARLAFGAAEDDAATGQALDAAAAAQERLWAATVAAVRPIATTAGAATLLNPTNEAFDLAGERTAARAARVPAEVLDVLLLYCAVAAATLGYVLAGTREAHRAATGVLFTLLALSVAVILDLDRPRTGAITVSQQPMIDVAATLSAP